MLEWQTLLLLIEGYLYANSSPFRTIPHQLAPRCQKALQPNFDETTRFSFFCLKGCSYGGELARLGGLADLTESQLF